jgi:polygalacturonase
MRAISTSTPLTLVLCVLAHVLNGAAPNTDGIDPDSSKNVLIENCVIEVGDDAIAIKSGMDYAGRLFNRSSENIWIRNSWFKSRHVSIGSEESGCVLGPFVML